MNNIELLFRERLTKYGFAKPAHLVLTLCVLCALYGKTPAQDFKQVHPGVEYAEVQHKIGDDPLKINLLRLDLKKVRLDVHHAFDRAIGLDTTSAIAAKKGAVAAINAGFFRLDRSEFAGDAADVLMIDGDLLSEGDRGRVVLTLENKNRETLATIAHSRTHLWLGSFDSRFRIRMSGVNRPPADRELVLFSPRFGPTTRVAKPGTDVVFAGCDRNRDKWQNVANCGSFRIVENATDTAIPLDGFVISTGSEKFADRDLLFHELNVYKSQENKKKRVFFRVEDALQKSAVFKQEHDIVAGVPLLIRNGKIDITWEQEKTSKAFVETRHPRTAVAKLKDGRFLMMTVDGRQPGVSVGMSLQELAEYLLSLGAVDAMNLDGGGSTTMVLDGKVVNKPSDKEGERKVSDAIVVTLRKR